MVQKLRVLIADDQPKVRLGLRLLLEREEHVDIVGEAGDIEELMDLLSLKYPELVLLDWSLSGKAGHQIIKRIEGRYSGVKVVVLSGKPEVESAAIKSGAIAFISKADPPEKLLEVLFSSTLTR